MQNCHNYTNIYYLWYNLSLNLFWYFSYFWSNFSLNVLMQFFLYKKSVLKLLFRFSRFDAAMLFQLSILGIVCCLPKTDWFSKWLFLLLCFYVCLLAILMLHGLAWRLTRVVFANTITSTCCLLSTHYLLASPTGQSVNQCLRSWLLKLALWADWITSRIKSVEIVKQWWVNAVEQDFFLLIQDLFRMMGNLDTRSIICLLIGGMLWIFSFITCKAIDRDKEKMVIRMMFMACLAAKLVCFLEYWSDVVSTGWKWIHGKALP